MIEDQREEAVETKAPVDVLAEVPFVPPLRRSLPEGQLRSAALGSGLHPRTECAMANEQGSDTPESARDGGPHRLEWIHRGVGFVEQGIATVVVLLLVVGVLMVFWDVVMDLGSAFPGGLGEHGLTQVLSQALLALMIAEIISSVASFFERRRLNAGPLLVIGIIASIRRLLVISAEAANFVSEGMEIPQSMLIELAILTVSVGIFAWSIRQVDGTNQAT